MGLVRASKQRSQSIVPYANYRAEFQQRMCMCTTLPVREESTESTSIQIQKTRSYSTAVPAGGRGVLDYSISEDCHAIFKVLCSVLSLDSSTYSALYANPYKFGSR